MESKLKKYGTMQLQKAAEKATGEKLETIAKILLQRGIDILAIKKMHESERAQELPEAIIKASKTAAKVVKEIRAKAKREVFAGHSKEAIAAAKANVGKECQFVPYRGTEAIDGKVSCLIFDSRVNRMFYRIKVAGVKKVYHVLISNQSFLVD